MSEVLTDMTYWGLSWILMEQLHDFYYIFIFILNVESSVGHFHPEAINFSDAYAHVYILTTAACFLLHGVMQPSLYNTSPGGVFSRVLNHTD